MRAAGVDELLDLIDRRLEIVIVDHHLDRVFDFGWVSADFGAMLAQDTELVIEGLDIAAVEVPDVGILRHDA